MLAGLGSLHDRLRRGLETTSIAKCLFESPYWNLLPCIYFGSAISFMGFWLVTGHNLLPFSIRGAVLDLKALKGLGPGYLTDSLRWYEPSWTLQSAREAVLVIPKPPPFGTPCPLRHAGLSL